MSSIIIYGEETNINKKRVITPETEPNPSSFYGDSKWQAEKQLTLLQSENFHLAIIRPPMIYGEGSKGNYQQLIKIANKLPLFPNIKNERSMLNIDRLCEFIKFRVDSSDNGVFFPRMKIMLGQVIWLEILHLKVEKDLLVFMVELVHLSLGYFPGKIGKLVNKAFGNLVYEKDC